MGADSRANANGVRFHFAAWKATAGRMALGSYLGNGLDDRSVSIGWQAAVVMVKGEGETGRYHPASLGYLTDLSLGMSAIGVGTSEIQTLQPTGFTLGTDARVNATGTSYYWMAFGNGPL